MTHKHAGGFTLLEVMVAIAILSILTASLWGTISDVTRARRNAGLVQDRAAQARFALDRMVRDVSMAFVSNHEDTLQAHRRTLFAGLDHSDQDELQFSTFGHERLLKDADESDATVVVYSLASDSQNGGKTSLFRRETRRLSYEDPKQAKASSYVVCEDVHRLNLRYYDAPQKEWRDEWNTTSADGKDYLPTKVLIELGIVDEKGKEVPFVTEVRIPLWQKLD